MIRGTRRHVKLTHRIEHPWCQLGRCRRL